MINAVKNFRCIRICNNITINNEIPKVIIYREFNFSHLFFENPFALCERISFISTIYVVMILAITHDKNIVCKIFCQDAVFE